MGNIDKTNKSEWVEEIKLIIFHFKNKLRYSVLKSCLVYTN